MRQKFPGAPFYDMLDSEVRRALIARPTLLREWIAGAPLEPGTPVILDEVQKVSELLDAVHWLIENRGLGFVLCGSSARKLRRGHANLLGGRAWRFEMFALVTAEVPGLDLDRALRHGLIPSHHRSDRPDRSLRSFVADYLTEEIAAEAATRNLGALSRFLELAGITNGQMVNYAKMASDVGVDAKSIRDYFEILEDTLIGRMMQPLPAKPGSRKNLVAAPKFFLFDPGIARQLRGSNFREARHAEGHLFETFIANEILAYLSYNEIPMDVHFYRTHTGAEVDFIVNRGTLAIEVTLDENVRAQDLRGLNDFLGRYPEATALVVCLEQRARVIEKDGRRIEILPWRDFCTRWWKGEWMVNEVR